MFTEISKPRKRGRPPGRTAEGDAARRRLFDTAIHLIGERGYQAATLREVARRAGVSPGLLYRYFPSKRAVVLALYDDLSDRFARRVADLPRGRWRDRFIHALELSLDVLGPHRITLRALTPTLVGDTDEGVFAEQTSFSRRRVEAVFRTAVVDADDAPGSALAESLGRVLYVLHLAVILWWLLDRSPGQRATRGLIDLLGQALVASRLALRLRPVQRLVRSAAGLIDEALLDEPAVS